MDLASAFGKTIGMRDTGKKARWVGLEFYTKKMRIFTRANFERIKNKDLELSKKEYLIQNNWLNIMLNLLMIKYKD